MCFCAIPKAPGLGKMKPGSGMCFLMDWVTCVAQAYNHPQMLQISTKCHRGGISTWWLMRASLHPWSEMFLGDNQAIPSQGSWFSDSSACSVSTSLHAVSNLAFTLESEISCSWWISWCYQGRRGRAIVKLSFSCCAMLFFPVLFLCCSPCRKWAVAPTMLSTILCIHPVTAQSHFTLVFEHLSFLRAFLKFGTATLSEVSN